MMSGMIAQNVLALTDKRLERYRAATSLNLHANMIESLAGLGAFLNLTSLNLSSNNIREFPTGSMLAPLAGTLQTLDLASNRIQRIGGVAVLTPVPFIYTRFFSSIHLSSTCAAALPRDGLLTVPQCVLRSPPLS